MKRKGLEGMARSRAGSSMVTVVILLGTMTVLALIFLRAGQAVSEEQLTNVDGARAAYLAEAGISEALEAMRNGESGAIASGNTPAYLGGGVVWVEATDLGNGRTQLDSMAMKDGARSALRVVIEDGATGASSSPAASGGGDPYYTMLFSNKALQLKQNVVIDSWDSSLGPYLLQALNLKGTTLYAGSAGGASSNGGVQLDTGVKVFGDAHSGPGKSVSLGGTAYVSGSTTPSPASVPLAPITVPVVASNGAYSVANNATKTINPGTYHYTSMTQGKNSVLKVIGPATIVLNSYVTGTTATLQVDCTNGPVSIYDTGVWSVDKFYKVEPKPGTPIDASFLISSTGTVQFDQGSKISFGFYCPNATIQVDQGAEVWGALVADQITVDSGTKFHFDEHLKGFELPWSVPASVLGIATDPDPQIVSWSKIDFPVQEFRRDRRNPFTLLGVQKAALPSPSDAWDTDGQSGQYKQ